MVYTAIVANYRDAFKARSGEDSQLSDSRIVALWRESAGFESGEEADEFVLERMAEVHAARV